MTNRDIKIALIGIDKSILHWIHDLYISLLMGKRISKKVQGWLVWEDTEKENIDEEINDENLLKIGGNHCALCIIYCSSSKLDVYCALCPLNIINDRCDKYNSSYWNFLHNPCTETAIKMIQSLARARDYYLDKEEYNGD